MGGMASALRDYQAAAVRAIATGLADGGRGQCIAACGTGKSIIAVHAADRLVPTGGLAVVACPSLALVSQMLAMWTAVGRRDKPLAVCGDETVTDSLVHVADLPCPVSTDPAQVARWVASTEGRRLIITTHRSVHIVGEALFTAGSRADLLIVDEAHHTAGRGGKHSALVHDDACLPADRRLYLTATPRYLASGVGQRRAPDGEAIVSMDDPEIFGPVLYSYPFGRAITEGWLDDYQVAVIGVTKPEVLAVLRRLDEDAVGKVGDPPLRTAVVQAALAQAAREFDLRRVLVFTPRVELAREFARSLPRTLSAIDDEAKPKRSLTAGSVNGQMTIGQRQRILRWLADPPDDGWAVIANARCLSEGVDVPAVDGVVFTHPKRSTVDVIQAVGRALRRNPYGTGVSTILVPILLPGDDMPSIDDEGEYATLWQVIRALRAHDETLAAELDTRRQKLKTGGAELPPRVLVRLPDSYDAEQFLRHLTIRLVENTTSPWLDGLAAAQRYHAEHGHLKMLVSYTAPDGFPLGAWISKQRSYRRRGWLSADRIAELDALGMVWDEFDRRWQRGVTALRTYVREHGDGRVPQRYVTDDGFKLGTWLSNRRTDYRLGKLPDERVAELEAAGMVWEDSDYDRGLAALRAFRAEHGHVRVPKGHVRDGLNLYQWIHTRRRDRRRGRLAPERITQLTELGIDWDPMDGHWARGIAAARKFYAEHGHLSVPTGTRVDGIDLKAWVQNRRVDFHNGRLSPAKIADLEAVGMVWSPYLADWERGLAAARSFFAREGHLRPGSGHWEDGVHLSAWVTRRRKEYRLGKLPADRKAALDEIGMQWEVRKGQKGRGLNIVDPEERS